MRKNDAGVTSPADDVTELGLGKKKDEGNADRKCMKGRKLGGGGGGGEEGRGVEEARGVAKHRKKVAIMSSLSPEASRCHERL